MRLLKSEYEVASDKSLINYYKIHLKELKRYIEIIADFKKNKQEVPDSISNRKSQEAAIVNMLLSILRKRKKIDKELYENL